jgi:hypothetical protein
MEAGQPHGRDHPADRSAALQVSEWESVSCWHDGCCRWAVVRSSGPGSNPPLLGVLTTTLDRPGEVAVVVETMSSQRERLALAGHTGLTRDAYTQTRASTRSGAGNLACTCSPAVATAAEISSGLV